MISYVENFTIVGFSVARSSSDMSTVVVSASRLLNQLSIVCLFIVCWGQSSLERRILAIFAKLLRHIYCLANFAAKAQRLPQTRTKFTILEWVAGQSIGYDSYQSRITRGHLCCRFCEVGSLDPSDVQTSLLIVYQSLESERTPSPLAETS